MSVHADEAEQLLQRAAAGDQEGWGELLARYRERLRRMVALRLDRRLQGRIDASDVIQDAYLEAARAWPSTCRTPPCPSSSGCAS